MSYEIFQKCEIGTVKELSVANGVIKFVKSGTHQWLVEYAVLTSGTFTYPCYTRFTTVLPEIKASCLYDTYSK